MKPANRSSAAVVLVACGLSAVAAQPPQSAPRSVTPVEPQREEPSSPRVVIDRRPLERIEPDRFEVALSLAPVREVRLRAPVTGTVQAVHLRSGDRVDAQREAVRLDGTEQELQSKIAEAEHRAAEAELKRAKAGGEPHLVAAAEARLEAARARRDLAEHRLQRTRIRVPFAATVFRVEAVAGQFVRPGDPLMTAGDTSQLRVEIPVDRRETAVGSTVQLSIEESQVSARVDSLLPLAERFEPLRELFPSAASAVVLVDNADRTFHAGQTVVPPLIPRHPITEIPTKALSNTGDGRRKIQVIRERVVRDVRVRLLGQSGPEHVYVSGPIAEGDEVILNASQKLADGTRLRPVSANREAETAAAQPDRSDSSSTPSNARRRPSTGSAEPDF